MVNGDIYDVAVDLRKSSKNFGDHVGIKISSTDLHMVWIPPGFAHGFYVLSEWAEIEYKTTDFYSSEGERTVIWNDSDLKIPWPIDKEVGVLLSDKDNNGVSFSNAEKFE